MQNSRLGQNIHPSADKIKIVLFHLVAEKGVVDQVNPSRHGIPQAIYKPEGDALFDPHGIRGLEKVSKLYLSLLTIDWQRHLLLVLWIGNRHVQEVVCRRKLIQCLRTV